MMQPVIQRHSELSGELVEIISKMLQDMDFALQSEVARKNNKLKLSVNTTAITRALPVPT